MNLTVLLGLLSALFCVMVDPALDAQGPQAVGSANASVLDPFAFSDGNKYYLFGSAPGNEGFGCFESTDLIKWKSDGLAWRMAGLHVAKGNLRQPKVFAYRGLFYMVYSARTPGGIRLALASSIEPQGPYHDVHAPWLPVGESAVGGNVFVDQRGKPYLIFSRATAKGSSLYGAALAEDLSHFAGDSVKLLQTDQRWEFGPREAGPSITSACVFGIGSKYYLIYSAGNPEVSTSALGYATADKPLGPWSKGENNPVLSGRAGTGVLSPSHVSVFRALDRKTWVLAYQNSEEAALGTVPGRAGFANFSLDGIRHLMLAPRPGDSTISRQ